MSFFDVPLAEKLRPRDFPDFVGNLVSFDAGHSVIIWGPPGCGKTSFARVALNKSDFQTFSMSAVVSGAQDFKSVFSIAERGVKVLLHIDEIHHLNKSQQDIFLPHIENGNITLIGTTTENPSFELRPALLSRCKVVVFNRLTESDLRILIGRCESYLGESLNLTENAKNVLCELADGDARCLLNLVQNIVEIYSGQVVDVQEISKITRKRLKSYDKNGENHYNLISAFHKSIRGSDPDAALYWFCRMLEGGENPLYIARRVVRIAVEDIGLADPNALNQAIAAQQAFSFLGSPEGELAIAQAVIYMATAPKSNAGYMAFNAAQRLVKKTGSFDPPKHILNAPTKLMKDLGYNEGYIYDHDTKECFSGQNYFPTEISRQKFYSPVQRGFEREIIKRVEYWNTLRKLKKPSE